MEGEYEMMFAIGMLGVLCICALPIVTEICEHRERMERIRAAGKGNTK